MPEHFTLIPRVSPGRSKVLNDRFAQLDEALSNRVDGISPIVQQRFSTPTTKTISGGVITIDQTFHQVDTQGGAGTDDLDTINGYAQGDALLLQNADPAREVVVKHATGNIFLKSGFDFSLSGSNSALWLYRLGNFWVDLRAKKPSQVTIYPWTALDVDGSFDVSWEQHFYHLRLYYMLRTPYGEVNEQVSFTFNGGEGVGLYDYVAITHTGFFTDLAFAGTQEGSLSIAVPNYATSYHAVGQADFYGCDALSGDYVWWTYEAYSPRSDNTGELHLESGGGKWAHNGVRVSSLQLYSRYVTSWMAGSSMLLMGWR